jgi:ABC-2 type transport system ATP-binding protein
VLELKATGKTIIFSPHQMQLAEEICEDICLLNRSKKVLSGDLREVRRSFRRNLIALRVEDGDGVLEDCSLLAKIERRGDDLEALLADGADAQDLLKRLVSKGARVTKFELVEPSLHDIFIEKVSEKQ